MSQSPHDPVTFPEVLTGSLASNRWVLGDSYLDHNIQ
jgi:hypothetical protein